MDTELIEGDVARSQVAVLVDVASKQGRVCLTRDHKLAEQRGSGAVYLLASDDAKEQFNDIQKRFGIRCSSLRFTLSTSSDVVHDDDTIMLYVACRGCCSWC